jgi:preprotein translocase subunit SecB
MSENTKSTPQQYSLQQLVLTELSFWRDQTLIADSPQELSHEETISVRNSELIDKNFSVALDYVYTIRNKEKDLVKIKVVQAGNFKCETDPDPENLELFMNINGPAIIFPFVREIISNVSTKAMIGAILIQPVNFVKMYNDNKAKESKP